MRQAARLGHLATGMVYVIVGSVALAACIDVRMRPVGSQGALHRILRGEVGMIALLAIALGLAADAVWQAVRAAVDADRAGRSLTGAANRIAWAFSGLIHLGLAVGIVKIALGIPQITPEAQVRRWTAGTMSLPFGPWLVAGAGLVAAGIGLVLLYRAWIADVDSHLDLTRMRLLTRAAIMGLGRFGLVARGLVLSLTGLLLIAAALELSPERARGLGGTFRVIQDQRYGSAILGVIALGFIANGLLELVRARYRRIWLR
ncbi:MAG TPA: DUF1206 domain-containing protein [Methylomirabilota bacterium]|nr:DUF1206 domain-containing protein [Methylomirabilota bacterium]